MLHFARGLKRCGCRVSSIPNPFEFSSNLYIVCFSCCLLSIFLSFSLLLHFRGRLPRPYSLQRFLRYLSGPLVGRKVRHTVSGLSSPEPFSEAPNSTEITGGRRFARGISTARKAFCGWCEFWVAVSFAILSVEKSYR